jgi:nitroimidazol reductase NimA-like FMN-containing flavoprotein (pyridoxamine 5'-phosphate oxidase superfamily)
MDEFHFRRPEKMMTAEADMLAVIAAQMVMTLALCQDNQPYLATVDYAYDADRRCFYFHSADHGKKIDYLAANPAVWGQVLDDRGPIPGQCDHAYRSVQFAGKAHLVEDLDEKRHALGLMIDRYEPDPEPVRQRLLVPKRIDTVTVGRIDVTTMTGKANG